MNRKSKFFVRFGRHGGLMKEDPPAGAGGGATPTAGGNNGGESSAAAGSGDSGGDNTGEEFDPAAFWASPAPAASAAPSGESAGGGQQESGAGGGGGEDLNTVLTNQLNTMTFGDPIFTPEIAAEINEGNFESVQKRFNSMMQNGVRQALAMNVQILRPFAEQLMNQMREELGGTLTTRDNNDALLKDFPAASNPAARPMIQQLYDQALKNTKGDRTKAVQQTKGMIRFMAGATADDLDLSVAPRGPDDSRPAVGNFNWLDELTGR